MTKVFNFDPSQDYYALIGLKFEKYANRYNPSAQHEVDRACEAAIAEHQKAMKTDKVNVKKAIKAKYKENLREILQLLKNKEARKAYDQARAMPRASYGMALQTEVASGQIKRSEAEVGNIVRHENKVDVDIAKMVNSQKGIEVATLQEDDSQPGLVNGVPSLSEAPDLDTRAVNSESSTEGLTGNEKQAEFDKLLAINLSYSHHLGNIIKMLEAYQQSLTDKFPLSDKLYQQKVSTMGSLLDSLSEVRNLFKLSNNLKNIKLDSMNYEEASGLLKTVESMNFAYGRNVSKFANQLSNPLINQPSGEFANKSVAEIMGMRRTALGWKDTGTAVLKGIVTVLANITVLPAVLTKLLTKQSVQSHLFKVKGADLNKGVERQLGGLDQMIKTIDKLYDQNHEISKPRR